MLAPDKSRVLIRNFEILSEQRVRNIMSRVLTLSESEVEAQLDRVFEEFGTRHQRMRRFYKKRFDALEQMAPTDIPLSEDRQLLIGSYLTQEYSLEAAALFNPSIVWHPDQSGLPVGTKRFIISLRATGEGHISSIVFRSGTIDAEGMIQVDEPVRHVTPPEPVADSRYTKKLFSRKLRELELFNQYSSRVMEPLPDEFTIADLRNALEATRRQDIGIYQANLRTAQGMMTLALSNYEVSYSPDSHLSERIIFPYSPAESNGVEDARFVEFREDDGSVIYYATYTAYDGRMILPQILETSDFLHFKVNTLNGPEIRNKGFALFPRRVNGQYVMLSRQDGENIYLMYSDALHFWYHKQLLLRPTFPWEYVQLGNCGSPIEIEEGWLVLSHGVGPMRKYAMGAFLLDKNDPSRVLGRTREPILSPDENEREGYVPNVVYSCGATVYDGVLVLPYAMSDYASSIATVPIAEILRAMV
ncbi:MAG: glycoside hydrolase family 130 protein [Armatimonadaceae bacterium]